MATGLMYLEIAGAVGRVVTLTARKALLNVVSLQMTSQVTQLQRLITTSIASQSQ